MQADPIILLHFAGVVFVTNGRRNPQQQKDYKSLSCVLALWGWGGIELTMSLGCACSMRPFVTGFFRLPCFRGPPRGSMRQYSTPWMAQEYSIVWRDPASFIHQ